MSLLGLAAGAWGASKQNSANAREAALSRQFNERLSRNKHQYETQDLKKAGLNRILSVTQGASAGSSSAQARYENVGEAGIRGANSAAQLRLLNAQTGLTQEKTQTERGDPRNIVGGGVDAANDVGIDTNKAALWAAGGAASAYAAKKLLEKREFSGRFNPNTGEIKNDAKYKSKKAPDWSKAFKEKGTRSSIALKKSLRWNLRFNPMFKRFKFLKPFAKAKY